jgi:hypothetical protein
VRELEAVAGSAPLTQPAGHRRVDRLGGCQHVAVAGAGYHQPAVGMVGGQGVEEGADLAEWEEAARITVPADPWPESGRGDRTWIEAAVLPGRRFHRLEWEEPQGSFKWQVAEGMRQGPPLRRLKLNT